MNDLAALQKENERLRAQLAAEKERSQRQENIDQLLKMEQEKS